MSPGGDLSIAVPQRGTKLEALRAGAAVIFLASFYSMHPSGNAARLAARPLNKSMNKKIILLTATLASALLWVGCNKSGKLNTPSQSPAPSGPVELKAKWPLGEHVVQSLDLKQ